MTNKNFKRDFSVIYISTKSSMYPFWGLLNHELFGKFSYGELEVINEIIFILLGALCATLGGFLSMWYQIKKARKLKFEERIGEKKVNVYGEALSLIVEVKGRWIQDAEKNTLKYVDEKTEWIWKNRAFLPSEFYTALSKKILLGCQLL